MADIDWEKGSMTPPAGGDVDWENGDIQPPKKPAGVIRRIADMTAVPLMQGVVGVPEAAVGIADLVTGGRAGKLAEDVGFRPREAKQIIGDALYSDEQKAANQKVAEAEGFFPTLQAAVENPSTIARTAVESLPSMFAGGAISRIARPVLGAMFTEAQLARMAPAAREAAIAASGARDITAGAIGEGAISAGQNAEQVRQEEPTGTLTPQQAAYLGLSGGITGVISRYSGGAAAKLGIADPETALARGSLQTATAEGAKKAAEKGIARKAAEGFFTEGVLEELPQSWQEQVFQNLAQGKPWNEGAGNAAATGLLAGGITGAAVGPFSHGDDHKPPPPPDKPLLLTHEPDPLIGFPDGTVARRSEAEAYLASLKPEQQAEVRARMLGINPQSPNAAAAVPPAPPPAPMGPITRAAMLLPPAEHLPQPEPQGEGNKAASGEQEGASQAPIAAPPVDPNGGPISRAAALAQGAPDTSVMGNAGSAPQPAQPEAQPASPTVPRGTPGFSHGPGDIVVDDHFEAAHTGATSQLNARPAPTEGQKEAENYPVGRTRVGGVGISIENGQGTERTGVDGDGKHWSTTMQDHYGRLLGTIGADSTPKKLQHIDVFVVPGTPKSWRGAPVIVDMVDPKTGLFDEHKVVFGAPSVEAGRAVIARNYNDGEARIGAATAVPFDTFKGWAYDGTQKSDPFDASVPTAHPGAAGVGAAPGPEAAGAGGVGGAQGPDLQAPAQPAQTLAPAPGHAAAVKKKKNAGWLKRRSESYDKNPFITFLADHGLFHIKGDPKSLKAEFSPDKAISVPGYHVAMFRRDGKLVDQLVQPAIEDGYLPHGADENDLYNLITRAMRGDRIIPAYAEGAIEQEVGRRQRDHQQQDEEAATAALTELSDEELAAFADADYDVPDLDAPSSVPTEAAMRSMGFTDEEIAHALRSEAESQPADATAPAARREGSEGPEQAAGGQATPAAASRNEAPAGQDLAPAAAPAAAPPSAPAQSQQAKPAADRGAVVELRKRLSALRQLRACVAGT